MSQTSTEQQLRSFLLAVTGFICIGTIVELILIEHTGDVVQWIPFIAAGIAFLSVTAAWIVPSRKTMLFLRAVMGAAALVSLYGIYEHFITNFEFSQEIHPAYSLLENVGAALKGASPMLAPGIFFLAALLAAAATYRHPVLDEG